MLKKKFEEERVVLFYCQCDSIPVDCLCENIRISVQLYSDVKSTDIIRNPMIISQWNPTFVLDDTLDMKQVRLAMAGKTLHVSVCCTQPPSFQQWTQVTKHINTMSTYRSDIRTYTPDEVVTSQRRAAAVKDGATVQRRNVEQAMASPEEQNIFIIKLLQEDLQALYV